MALRASQGEREREQETVQVAVRETDMTYKEKVPGLTEASLVLGDRV